MIIDKALFDSAEEEIVQSGVDKKNQDFGSPVPVFVDFHKSVMLVRIS